MDGGAEPLLRPLPARPRALRQRSQSAVTKSGAAPPEAAADSDASKRSSKHGHRHTQSHHHIPHHPKRFVKDKLGLQNGSGNSTAELSKTVSRASYRPVQGQTQAQEDVAGSRKGSQSLGVGVVGLDAGVQRVLAAGDGDEMERLVLEEQWKNQKRQRELQSTLYALNEESMKTTRRLDNLYYSLLEKLSGLRSTISNLQELAGLTAQLHNHFREDTSDLTSDLHRQIEALAGFKAQQVKIGAIDERLAESKRKADGLSERLERARKRVARLEESEKEWQDSVSWRLRLMWIILGTIAGILLIFLLMHILGVGSTPDVHTLSPEIVKLSLASLATVPTSVTSVLEDVIGHSLNTSVIDIHSTPSGMSSISSRVSKLLEPTTPAERDPLLKIFDEL